MRSVQRSALVPYSPEQMFRLVDDIERYPEFLPWCSAASVDSIDGDRVTASLELNKGGLRKTFTTRNTRHEFDAIDLTLVGGPFRRLEGGWRFADLDGQGCKVSLALDFEFESRMIDMLLGSYFESTCNSLVEAFTQRAAGVYGAGR